MYKITLLDAVAANANTTSTPTVLEYPLGENMPKHVCDKGNISIEVVMTGNGTTGVVKLQSSDNGTTFNDVDNMSITLTAAGTYTIGMTNAMKKYYQLDYNKGNASTGAITATLTAN